MIKVRPNKDRGSAHHGWLETKHSFSFAHYYDPQYMGFRSLRVINEDIIAGGGGFPTHHHENMEIITYVISGALEHKDSMGTGSVIKAGDVQYMSAGTGVQHSEYNASETMPVHLLQIWLLPNEFGVEPRYNQRSISKQAKQNKLCLLASGGVDHSALRIRQEVRLYASCLESGKSLEYSIEPNRAIWLQNITGQLRLNNTEIEPGDGVSVEGATKIRITSVETAEFLLFDLI
ncbi:MAG: pirin family protein [Candidatus Saccharibacteria bacterium]